MRRRACREDGWLPSSRSAGGGCEQHEHAKAASSPSLHQLHLYNKLPDLISSRSARMKPSSCSPGWSSSPSPGHRLHLCRGDETPRSRQPKRCKSMKRGPSRGHPPTTTEGEHRVPSPGWSCHPPRPACHHSQHRPCPSEKDTTRRWQLCPSNSSHHSSPWTARGRSWLSHAIGYQHLSVG